MKIGVSSYSFTRIAGQVDVIAKAKEIGFDVIEFAGLPVPESETLESVAHQTQARCLAPGGLTMPCP